MRHTSHSTRDTIPDVRDGLTRVERIVLYVLHEAEKEFPGRNVPTAFLYGRVVEHITLSIPEFQQVLTRLTGELHGGHPGSMIDDR